MLTPKRLDSAHASSRIKPAKSDPGGGEHLLVHGLAPSLFSARHWKGAESEDLGVTASSNDIDTVS